MKIIILECTGSKEIINHFAKYGFSDVILFKNRNDRKETEREANITELNGFSCEGTRDKLLKIKGSLEERFFVVYSNDITIFDINNIIKSHKGSQKIATLIEYKKALCAAFFEREVVDYMNCGKSLERDVLKRIGEEQELAIYK